MREQLIEAWADTLLTTTRPQCIGEYRCLRERGACATGILFYDVFPVYGIGADNYGKHIRLIGSDLIQDVKDLNDDGWSFQRIAHMLKAMVAEPARELVNA